MNTIQKGIVSALTVCAALLQIGTTHAEKVHSDFALQTGPGAFVRTINAMADLTPSKSFTLEVWFKPHGSGVLVNEVDGYDINAWDYSLAEITAANNLVISLPGITGSVSLGAVEMNEWNNLTLRYDNVAHTYDGFLNGVKKGTLSGTRTAPNEAGRFAYFAFGREASFHNQTGVGDLSADLDETRLWKVARTDIDIAKSYNKSIGSTYVGLSFNWHIDDGSGDYLGDASGANFQGLNVGCPWIDSDLVLRLARNPGPPPSSDYSISVAGGGFFRTESVTQVLTPAKSFTYEGWFKAAGPGVLITEVDAYDINAWDYSLLEINSSGNLIFGLPGLAGSASLGPVDTGKWYHVALRYDVTSHEYAGFLNGVKITSLSGTRSAPWESGRLAYFAFGRAATLNNLSGAGDFSGEFDEIRVWGTARTDANIRNTWRNPIGGAGTGLNMNWHMNEGAGSFISDASDRSNPGLNWTGTWTPSNLRLHKEKIPKDTAVDYAIQTSPGVFFRTENPMQVLTPAKTFTLELWFKPSGAGVIVNEVDAFDISQWDYSILEVTSGGNLVMALPGIPATASLGAVTNGAWTHAAIRYDEVTHVYNGFLNGNLVATLSGTRSAPFEAGRWAYFAFGREATLSGGGYFSGSIDEVRLWQNPRADHDIQSSWKRAINTTATGLALNWHLNQADGTFIPDASASANTGLNVFAPWVVSDLKLKKEKLPRNSGDYALHTQSGTYFRTENVLDSMTPDKTFTLEVWFKAAANAGVIVNEVDAFDVSQWDYSIVELNSAGHVLIGLPGITGVADLGLATNGVWNHVAIRYDNATGNYDGFLNGKKEGTLTGARSAPWESGRLAYFAFGRDATVSTLGGGGFFNGDFDDIRLWNNLVTDYDIKHSRKKTVPNDAEGLVLDWRLDDAAGSFLSDESVIGNNGLDVGALWTTSTRN